MFLLFFRERPCQDQRIDHRDDNQNRNMNKTHFNGKICVVCKRTERVYGRMDDDTGKQASATIKKSNKQKTDRDCKNDLANVIYKVHTASVEQVNDMPYTESYA